jgi:hypothetical protein
MSLLCGELPKEWCTSNITALFKKGAKTKLGNYRPVSLTCIVCKLLESLIRDEIMEHFIKNKLFSAKQFGFIRGRSTVLQLLKMLDQWTALLDEGGSIEVIYTDFEKAFDMVPHRRLIKKLESYGICAEVIRWIEGFLLNRQQRTRVRGHYSGWERVRSGIPQGSVLGPLLFVIFINDLPEIIEGEGDIYLFADDAKISKQIRSVEDQVQLQERCNALQSWSEKWLLKLNISKCKVLRLSNREQQSSFTYSLTEAGVVTELEEVKTIRDLGVLVDSKLTFKNHILEKVSKAYSMIGIIKRNFKHVDKDTFLSLYKCMVRSQLEYANSVWNPHAAYLMEDLERVQKRATKMIPECKGKTYIERLKLLRLPSLVYRRHRGDMIEVYKILHGVYDEDTSLLLENSRSLNTRGHSLKLETIRSRYDVRKYSFRARIVSIWNSLTEEIVTAGSINSFKNRLDRYWAKQEVLYDWKAKLSGTGIRSINMGGGH